MKLLIPGGAGYIGSHMVRYALEHGNDVVVLDDFSTGHKWAVNDCEILDVNLLDKNKLSQLLRGRHFDGIIHFAAKSIVSESFKKPDLYYANNVIGTVNLIDEMLKNDISNLVFSSSAAIYGSSSKKKINEDHPKEPINPYGRSKLITEKILLDYCNSYNLNATSFRYFNAAGAHKSGDIGEAHTPETHLIPNILKSILSKKSDLRIFGNDYATPDGTCIRDYIHVQDLANAHMLGLKKCQKKSGFSAYNLGNGNGFSVLEVIKASENITDKKINYKVSERRDGDPPFLVSDSSKAAAELGWHPKFSDLNTIINSAWEWHKTMKT